MKTHENQPATGKTHFPGVGGGVFTSKALKCPSGPAGAAARLVPREVDLYKHSHDGWLWSHCRHLELYFTTKDAWDHSELEDGFCMTFKTLRKKHLILCDYICRVNQSKSLRQQHKSSEALRFLYIYLFNELAPTNHGPLDGRSHKSRSYQTEKLHYSTLVIWITALIMTYHDQTIE